MSKHACIGKVDLLSEDLEDKDQSFSIAEPSAPPLPISEGIEQSLDSVTPFSSQALQGAREPPCLLGNAPCNSSVVHVAETLDNSCEDETDHCPICFESIRAEDAVMRCAGDGGSHHYFHASCLQQWIGSARESHATCPMCRGSLQLHGQRLNEYLQSDSQSLNDEDRSVLQKLADGLQGRNGWSDMDSIERAAHVGGIAAAAGWGFMLGYSGNHQAERATLDILHIVQVPRNHWIAQGVGWAAGVLVRMIRELVHENSKRESRDEENARKNRR